MNYQKTEKGPNTDGKVNRKTENSYSKKL
jgi:hypothetical protein